MPPTGFEPTTPASEGPQTYALDRASTGTGNRWLYGQKICRCYGSNWDNIYNNFREHGIDWLNMCGIHRKEHGDVIHIRFGRGSRSMDHVTTNHRFVLQFKSSCLIRRVLRSNYLLIVFRAKHSFCCCFCCCCC